MPTEPEPEEEMNLDLLNVQSALQLQVSQDVIPSQFWLPVSPGIELLQPFDTADDAVVKEMCGSMEGVLAFHKIRDQSRDGFGF